MKVSLPTVTEDKSNVGGTRLDHPCFGQIYAGRRQGSHILYGSDFVSHSAIALTISRSELHRSLSHDWYHDKSELIEIVMSEAQWATMISSLNIGGGVPCTIQHVLNQEQDQLPSPPSRKDMFASDMLSNLNDAKVALGKALTALSSLGLSKPKEASVRGEIEHALRELGCNAQYVTDKFDEHMENSLETLKVEANAYIMGAVTKAGLSALGVPAVTQSLEDLGNDDHVPL